MIREESHLTIRLAESEQDLQAAQRLRYEVFVQELGGTGPLVDHEQRLERDEFDPFFDHLILVDERKDQTSLDYVVGVYRVLTSADAARCGRFYSETEYELAKLHDCGRVIAELGRSCVHRDYRGGLALFQLWTGLENYISDHGIDILFGVASFHGTDFATLKESLTYLHHHHLAPEELRVRARDGWFRSMDVMAPEDIDRRRVMKDMPGLIKAYLRLGGYVGEGAFIDHAFNTTDVLLLMDTARINDRQRKLYRAGAGQ
ncbi:MAG: GNAT family N-acetyltransferase [Paracoccaceae bacterium]